ncbi:hypothetical protein [Longimicrobium sp.]|jgi:hypothetical protein|uniref:hypothetical protein n=1 Tax=Longimicrobium sp. TaxID=2029185 RepID=UPI002ED9C06B
MGRPLFLIENLANQVMFPAHLVTASSEASRAEVWRVATGRRSWRDRWTPGTDDAESWIRIECASPRSVDMLVLDRGHNLAGRRVILEASADGFVANVTPVLDVVIPAAAAVPGSIDGDAGALTEEGAWLKRFPAVAAADWQLRVPAMGPGLRPEIVGLWVGRAWSPLQYLDLPWGDESIDLQYQAVTTDAAWSGAGRGTRARTGEIGIKLSPGEYPLARYHIRDLWWVPRPGWLVYDSDQAERAVLALPTPGRAGFEQQEGWSERQAILSWIEHEPQVS